MNDIAVDEKAATRLDELLARAEALVPTLKERSARCNEERSCPEATVADYADAGILQICMPGRFGGFELPWDALCRVSRVLARGCGSQAWVANIYNDHCQLLGMFPLEAQEEVWGAKMPVRISASVEPAGTAKRVPGGVRLSGRHRFSSGVDHAQWVLAGGHIVEDGKPPLRSFFLVPRSDIEIVDDWFVVGLAGTGSKSFVVKDAFVPEHRILDGVHNDEGTGPGTLVNTAALYRMPRHDIAGTSFAAVGLGVAEAFLDEYVAYTRGRSSRGAQLAELQGTQIGIGASAAELLAADRLLFAAARAAMAVLERGERLSREERTRTRLAAGYSAQLMLAAVQRLFNASGSRGLFLDSPMQRLMRDLYGVAAHRGLAWDSASSNYGALRLGRAQ